MDKTAIFPLNHDYSVVVEYSNGKQAESSIVQIDWDSTDNDNIPDAWETRYGLNPEDASDAFLDPDGDRIPNVYEWANGTDPLEANPLTTTYIVDPSLRPVEGATVYPTIQAAINAAPEISEEEPFAYTTIKVRSGTYNESPLIDNKRILLSGESEDLRPPSIQLLAEPLSIKHGGTLIDGIQIASDDQFRDKPLLVVEAEKTEPVRLINTILQGGAAGALQIPSGDVHCLHCTLTNNTAEENAQAVTVDKNVSFTFTNSILWNESSSTLRQIKASYLAEISVNNSFIKGGEYRGYSNNPLLTIEGFLLPDSPAIMDGRNPDSVLIDIQGEKRLQGDIGADEWVDSDKDGLGDYWEKKYFGDLSYNGEGDLDGDGFNDNLEYRYGMNPNKRDEDNDNDGLPSWWEERYGLSDNDAKDSSADSDKDGLTNRQEFNSGTNHLTADSDGDQMPDGFEVAGGLDPLDASGADGQDGDPDGDGVSNFEEYLNGSNPGKADTDGDGVNDRVEIDQGSDPNNSADEGKAPKGVVEVVFTIGDPSGSHSENWRMCIKGTGEDADTRSLIVKGKDFGVMSDPTTFKLQRNKSYEVSIEHLGTKEDEETDYDWEATIDEQPGGLIDFYEESKGQIFMAGNHWVVDNRETVFTRERHGDTENIVQGKKAFLLPVEIVPDYNRDGKIDEEDRNEVTKNNPWRWWLNDDDDESEIAEGKDSKGDVPGKGSPDHSDMVIDGLRDLVDFFPLHLNLKQVLENLPEDGYKYCLKHKDSAIKFREISETKLEEDYNNKGTAAYLKNLEKAKSLTDSSLKEANSDGTMLSNDMLEALKKGEGILICEVVKETDEPLVLIIKSDDDETVLGELELPLKTSEVEKMYRHGNMRNQVAGGSGGLRTQLQNPGEAYPDNLTNGKYFVFVHGFNVPAEKARGWHAEVFKRMHQMGSKARFIGISWHGDVSPDYHKAVKHAFLTSEKLGSWLNVGNAELTIAAHSLGNMVVGNAIEYEEFSPARYYLINAAVPIEAYDSTQETVGNGEKMAPRMTENSWKAYNAELYASNWYDLFADGDGRRKLTWKNRFARKVPGLAYNFYSTGEDVVENADKTESFGGNIFLHGFVKHAWVQGEIAKGNASAAADLTLKDTHAGWAFNFKGARRSRLGSDPSYLSETYFKWETNPSVPSTFQARKYTPQEASRLTQNELKVKPFYQPFKYSDLYDGAKGSAEAQKKIVQYELLATAIPAQSYAAAANPVEVIEERGGENFDMMNEKNGGWPRRNGLWHHSDFRDVAYSYVWKMYEKMSKLGKLDQ